MILENISTKNRYSTILKLIESKDNSGCSDYIVPNESGGETVDMVGRGPTTYAHHRARM